MKINQLKIGIILSYVSTAITMITGLVYTPVMIRLLGQGEYGLYTLVGSVVSYLSLFSLGLTGAYLRFYSRYNETGDRQGVAKLNGQFAMLFAVLAGLALICGMVLSLFPKVLFGSNLTAPELSKAQLLMQILVVNIALTLPSSLFESFLASKEQFLFQRCLNLAGSVCNPLICLPLLLLGQGSVMLVIVTTLITTAKLVVNIWFCLKKLHIAFSFREPNWHLLREIAGFSVFLFINMLIDQINWSVDKVVLGHVSGTADVAIYGVGATINSLFIGFSTAISSVFAPGINRIAARKAPDMCQQFTSLMIKVGRVQFLVLGLIASGFVFFGKYFITNIYAGPEYLQAYTVTLLLILPAMIPLIQNLGIEIQRAVNKHRARSIIYLCMSLLNVAASIPLARAFGPAGAALGTTCSLLLANGLIMNIYYHKAIGIDMLSFWRSILKLARFLILPVICGILILHFVTFSGVLSFLLWIVLYTGVYCCSAWFFGMNEQEHQIIRSSIIKFRRRKQYDSD